MYNLVYAKSFKKDLRKIDPQHRRLIADRISLLRNNPRPVGSDKLKGSSNLYRVRQGDYRIIYEITDETITVTIITAGHRKDVYDRI